VCVCACVFKRVCVCVEIYCSMKIGDRVKYGDRLIEGPIGRWKHAHVHNRSVHRYIRRCINVALLQVLHRRARTLLILGLFCLILGLFCLIKSLLPGSRARLRPHTTRRTRSIPCTPFPQSLRSPHPSTPPPPSHPLLHMAPRQH
jgi:hypothetical protein